MTLQEYVNSKKRSEQLYNFLDQLRLTGVAETYPIVKTARWDLLWELTQQYTFEQHPRLRR